MLLLSQFSYTLTTALKNDDTQLLQSSSRKFDFNILNYNLLVEKYKAKKNFHEFKAYKFKLVYISNMWLSCKLVKIHWCNISFSVNLGSIITKYKYFSFKYVSNIVYQLVTQIMLATTMRLRIQNDVMVSKY